SQLTTGPQWYSVSTPTALTGGDFETIDSIRQLYKLLSQDHADRRGVPHHRLQPGRPRDRPGRDLRHPERQWARIANNYEIRFFCECGPEVTTLPGIVTGTQFTTQSITTLPVVTVTPTNLPPSLPCPAVSQPNPSCLEWILSLHKSPPLFLLSSVRLPWPLSAARSAPTSSTPLHLSSLSLCDHNVGLSCMNTLNGGMCPDYEVRFYCDCSSHCDQPMNVADNGAIRDNMITASSERPDRPADDGRLDHPTSSWVPTVQDANQWIQVDLGEKVELTGIITQGQEVAVQPGFPEMPAWVTSYVVLYSTDGVNFFAVPDLHGNPQQFQGNYDSDSHVQHIFAEPIEAQYIRVQPLTWANFLSFRFELLGCRPFGNIPDGETQTTTPSPTPMEICPYGTQFWTPFMSAHHPDTAQTGVQETETYDLLSQAYNLCGKDMVDKIICRESATHMQAQTGGMVTCDLENGLVCNNAMQPDHDCVDYEPAPADDFMGGETESLALIASNPRLRRPLLCGGDMNMIADIQCREVASQADWQSTGALDLQCDTTNGFYCSNSLNYPVGCEDFEISVVRLQQVLSQRPQATDHPGTDPPPPHPTTEVISHETTNLPQTTGVAGSTTITSDTTTGSTTLPVYNDDCPEGTIYWTPFYNSDDTPTTGTDGGDHETYQSIVQAYGDELRICDEAMIDKVLCRHADSHLLTIMTNDEHVECDLQNGLVCLNSMQSDGMCENYEISFRYIITGETTTKPLMTTGSITETTASTTIGFETTKPPMSTGDHNQATDDNWLHHRDHYCVYNHWYRDTKPPMSTGVVTSVSTTKPTMSTGIETTASTTTTTLKPTTVQTTTKPENPAYCVDGWTPFMNSYSPDNIGDIETYSNLREIYEFCPVEMIDDIDCRVAEEPTTTTTPGTVIVSTTGQITLTGVVTEPQTEPTTIQVDTTTKPEETTTTKPVEETTPQTTTVSTLAPAYCPPGSSAWTPFMSADSPIDGNDIETIDALREKYSFCEDYMITNIVCRREGDHITADMTSQNVLCHPQMGLTCYSADNNGQNCYNFEVSFFCDCNCKYAATSATTTTTKPIMTTQLQPPRPLQLPPSQPPIQTVSYPETETTTSVVGTTTIAGTTKPTTLQTGTVPGTETPFTTIGGTTKPTTIQTGTVPGTEGTTTTIGTVTGSETTTIAGTTKPTTLQTGTVTGTETTVHYHWRYHQANHHPDRHCPGYSGYNPTIGTVTGSETTTIAGTTKPTTIQTGTVPGTEGTTTTIGSVTTKPTTQTMQTAPQIACIQHGWSDWMNVDRPTTSIDELRKYYTFCANPTSIKCREVGTNTQYDATLWMVVMSVTWWTGFQCTNDFQWDAMCSDYEVSATVTASVTVTTIQTLSTSQTFTTLSATCCHNNSDPEAHNTAATNW
ncbi:hypothetical protein Bbelb_447440, partial [Branchiostoma belcheri]